MVDSLQLLVIATFIAVVRQRPNLTVARDKLALPKPSSQPVLTLSIAGHRHLET